LGSVADAVVRSAARSVLLRRRDGQRQDVDLEAPFASIDAPEMVSSTGSRP
jgi:hypothetical protein